MNALVAALRYAELGWPVFPLHSVRNSKCSCGDAHDGSARKHIGKHPRTKRGFKDATTDSNVIRGWGRTWPDANYGLAMGEDSGLWALDVDTDKGGEDTLAALCTKHGDLPATIEALTGSGGRHFLFKHPGWKISNSAETRLGPGLDTRGDGGYIVAAPSIHYSGRMYEWRIGHEPGKRAAAPSPAWLLEMLRDKPRPKATGQNPYGEAAIGSACAAIRGASEGHRNDTLNREAFGLYQLVGGGVLDEARVESELRAAALAAGLSASEVDATIRSAQAGTSEPRSPPPRDPPKTEAPKAQRSNIFRDAFRRFTLDEVETDPPPQRYILRPYIPEGVVCAFSGAGASKKTTLMTYLAVCRAIGRQMFDGLTPEEGETAIVTTEDRLIDYRRKLANWRHRLGIEFNARKVQDRIHMCDLSGIPVRMVFSEYGQYLPTTAPDDLAEALLEKAPNARLVIMETINRFTGGVETNDSLGTLVAAAERVCRLANVAVILVGHVSQDAALSGAAHAYISRGGTALVDNARSSMGLTKITAKNKAEFTPNLDSAAIRDLLVLTHGKANGPMADPLVLRSVITSHGVVLEAVKLPTAAPPTDDDMAERVRLVAKRLQINGISVTMRQLKLSATDLGVTQNEIERLVGVAVAIRLLRHTDEKCQGGGKIIAVADGPEGFAR